MKITSFPQNESCDNAKSIMSDCHSSRFVLQPQPCGSNPLQRIWLFNTASRQAKMGIDGEPIFLRHIKAMPDVLRDVHDRDAAIWHERNQPRMSSGVTAANARAMAADNSGCVRAAKPRKRKGVIQGSPIRGSGQTQKVPLSRFLKRTPHFTCSERVNRSHIPSQLFHGFHRAVCSVTHLVLIPAPQASQVGLGSRFVN